jgi:8-oxo-dGTP pyrophosphatase MutT (NUDIX family)
MEINNEILTMPARAAATVVMLRDAAQGLEVFLIKRHSLSDVLGGAYVFPGGKVDALDAELNPEQFLDQTPEELHQALHEGDIDTRTATSLYVAAVREAFEESGVLFASSASACVTEKALDLLKTGQAFPQVLNALTLKLDTRQLAPWSRWITPKLASVSKKRFDTRFFVAAVPQHQTARHDNHEATEGVWLTPQAALAQYWEGQIELAPPQIMSLSHLARHPSTHSVMTQARSRTPPVIEPEPFDQDGVRVICYPGDLKHSVPERALPGPTRLQYQNKRFEPVGGLSALLE